MDRRRRRRQLNVPVTAVANGGFGRTGGGTVGRTGTVSCAGSARPDNGGTADAAGNGAGIGGGITRTGITCSGGNPISETLDRRRREIVRVLRSGRIFA